MSLSPSLPKLLIQVYKTNVGLFIRPITGTSYNKFNAVKCLDRLRFNGTVPASSAVLRGGFIHMPTLTDVTKVEQKLSGVKKFSHLELNEPSLTCATLPLRIICSYRQDSESGDYTTDDDAIDRILPLYSPVYTPGEDVWSELQFTLEVLGELDIVNFTKPVQMSVVTKTDFQRVATVDLSDVVQWSEIEEMLTPEFLLHERPCYLPIDALFNVIRTHVKQHINPTVAVITGDYDSAFKVKKIIPVTKMTLPVPVLNRPQPKTSKVAHRNHLVTCFDMATSDHLSGYSMLSPIEGPDLKSVAGTLKSFLDDLMVVINTPVQLCEQCNGHGHHATQVKSVGDLA